MKKIYEKNELVFSLIWVGIYIVLMSVGDLFSEKIGILKIITAPVSIVITFILYLWISNNNLEEKYGLRVFEGKLKKYLFFIPLFILSTTNLWWGVSLKFIWIEIFLYFVSMLCVGFLEEVIFRGFLFNAMIKTNIKHAIIISSVTFGFGHIINIFSGSKFLETSIQICCAVAIGFLFTVIFLKGKSLWPCIITHSVINCLSVFENKDVINFSKQIVVCLFICAVSVEYALYILIKVRNVSKT